MITANTAFADMIKTHPEEIKGMDIFKINNRLLGRTDLIANLKEALEKGENFQIRPGKPSIVKRDRRIPGNGPDHPYQTMIGPIAFSCGLQRTAERKQKMPLSKKSIRTVKQIRSASSASRRIDHPAIGFSR